MWGFPEPVWAGGFTLGTWTLWLCLGLAAPATAGTLANRVFETRLANGLKVLMVEESKAPVVSVQVWYKVGSRNEQAGKSGLSHMIEHMMFKGTPSIAAKEFEALIARNGGDNNAYTTADFTAYTDEFAADRVELALRLEADRMNNLLLEEKDFEPERQVVAEERRLRIEDQPANLLSEAARAMAFMAHPYRWPTIGWPSDIQAYTRDDLVRHYRTYYRPNNAVLIVVGAIRVNGLLPKIHDLFDPIAAGRVPSGTVSQEPPQLGERRLILHKEAELPILFAVYHAPNLRHPDSPAVKVLATVLGGGDSARLYQRLVYREQVASYAEVEYEPAHVEPHLLGISVGPAPGKRPDLVEHLALDEVERLQREPVGERELQKAKNQIEAQFLVAEDSTDRLADLLGRYEIAGGWRLLDDFLDGVRRVTAADVQRVARSYLIPDNRTVAILLPAKPELPAAK